MKYDQATRTFDCDPTLTDTQVLDFCKNGFLVLDGAVDDETNRRTLDYLGGESPANPSFIPEGLTNEDLERIRNSRNEPSTILLEDWFNQNVILNPQVAGALRSLLGKNVGMPVLTSQHTAECPGPAGDWHHDDDCVFGPEVNYLEVFYYPQDTPVEMGPTEVLPGSHIGPMQREAEDKGLVTAGASGTLVIHSQSILHRKSESTGSGVRHMLKFNYWRTVPPAGDWIVEPEFDLHKVYYGGHGVARYVAHMLYWLSGKGDQFRVMGGQAWPWKSLNQIAPSHGFARTEGYLPDWRRNTPDGYAK